MQLESFYRDYLQIEDEEVIQKAAAASRIREIKAGEYLFKQGDVPMQICFLIKGIMRGFLSNVNGKDITDCLCFRCGETVMPDGEFQRPASINIEALEDSQLVCIDLETVQELLENYPSLSKIHEWFLIRSANLHRALKIATYQYTATQRYQWFLKEYPGLIDRIPHRYIASLLNMTPVTLSKIRRSLKDAEAS